MKKQIGILLALCVMGIGTNSINDEILHDIRMSNLYNETETANTDQILELTESPEQEEPPEQYVMGIPIQGPEDLEEKQSFFSSMVLFPELSEPAIMFERFEWDELMKVQETTAAPKQELKLLKREEITLSKGKYYIMVNTGTNCVTVYTMDEQGKKETPVKSMACSSGLEKGSTPEGVFSIYQKYVWRPLFGNVEGQYASRFNGHILIHSVPYVSQKKNTLKSGEYNKLGEPASQGCVRLSVADAKWIYDNCSMGTVVEVRSGTEADDVLGKPAGIRISESSPFLGWDPTDPDKNNPWIGKLPVFEELADIEVGMGYTGDVLAYIKAVDFDGTELEVFTDTVIDCAKAGEYDVRCSITGYYGATVTEIIHVSVVE